MADILQFPKIGGPEKFAVILSGDEWVAIMLKLAGRATGDQLALAESAEPKIIHQLAEG